MKRIVFIFSMFLLMHPGLVYAADTLQVQKVIEKEDIKVGDDVSILLKFTNPFGRELQVKIVDKNVFGNNGLDIQCLEYTLPDYEEVTVEYDPIKPFKSGNYTLDAAKITYVNPETGKEEMIESNTLNVSVNDSGIQQGQAQGITTVYRCGGMNVQSTSYSSSTSPSTVQQQQSKKETPDSRVQNNQMNQNTNALKQEMNKQLQQQKQMREEFQRNLEKNREFQKQHEDLLNSGFNLTDTSLNPSTNNTGDFNLSYQKPDGEKASMTGEMKEGEIEKLMVQTDEDKQKILESLKQNKEFQKYNTELMSQGFNQKQPVFNQLTQNHTEIEVPYNNSGEVRRVTADYVDGEIRDVRLEKKEDEKPNLWIIVIAAVVLFVLGLIAYRLLKKPEPLLQPIEEVVKPLDYLTEAKRMVDEAEDLFSRGQEKDAYEMVSQAIRFYFSHKLDVGKEMVNTELLNLLKRRGIDTREVWDCLNLCSLVEFAKYKTNKNDFDEIIKHARNLIT